MKKEKKRLFGITVLADFVLNEGIDGILDNITERAGANAIAVNPIVTAEAEEGQGSWQPPADAGSSPRLFDRPLWGKTSLWVRSGPSYRPNESLYADSHYKPKQPNDLTETYGQLVGDFIDAALERDIKVYLQIPSITPSGMRDEDRPRLPNGEIPDRMADTGSLASPANRAYVSAFIHDLLEAYPNVTGFRPDWPEYPCYFLPEAFQDFNDHVGIWANDHGFDFASIHHEVGRFYDYLHGGLSNRDLEEFADVERGKWAQTRLLRQFPDFYEWLRLKRALSLDLLTFWRDSITAAAGPDKELSANAFMPPLTMWTGLDLAGASEICNAVSPKLYTMHWSAMVEFWGRVLLDHNDGLDEELVVRSLVNLFDIDDQATASKISDYGYPLPDEPHPIPNGPQERRIRQAITEVRGKADTTFLMHGYGPPDDFARRFKLVAESEADGVWINRYGYLSDEKLSTVGGIWKEANGD
jgi:hypothetical protein